MQVLSSGIEFSDDTYFHQHGITELLKKLIHDLQESKPTDHIAFISQWLTHFSSSPTHTNENLGADEVVNDAKTKGSTGCSSEVESEGTLGFALFTPVKELTLDTQISSDNNDPTPYIRFDDKNKKQVNTSGDVESSDAVVESPTKLQMAIASSFLESHPSMKQLLDAAQRLSPSEHVAALVFVEGLLDKSRKALSISPHSFGAPAGIKGTSGFTTSIMEVDLSKDSQSTENIHRFSEGMSSTQCEFGVESTIYLQDLVRDALAMSVVPRGPGAFEEEGEGEPFPIKDLSASVLSCPSCGGCEAACRGSHVSQLGLETPCRRTVSGHEKPVESNEPMELGGAEEKHTVQSGLIRRDLYEDERNRLRYAVHHYEPFDGMSDTQKETFIRCMERICFIKGQDVCLDLERTPWCLFFVHSGSIAFEKNGKLLRVFTPGHLFGQMEFMQDTQLNGVTTIRTLTDKAVLYIMLYKSFKLVMENENMARDQLFLDHLSQCELFSILSTSERQNFLKDMRVHYFEQGSVIQKRGHSVEWLSLVMSGTIRFTGRIPDLPSQGTAESWIESLGELKNKRCIINDSGEVVLEIAKGHLVGDFELVLRKPAHMDAVALTPVVVGRIHATFFKAHFDSHALKKMEKVMRCSQEYTILRQIPLTEVLEDIIRAEEIQKIPQSRRSSNNNNNNDNQVPNNQSERRWSHTFCSTRAPPAPEGLPNSPALLNSFDDPENYRHLRSSGELIFSGKQNIYRFPGMALATVNTVIIAVVADGTLIRWNTVITRITGFEPHSVLGHRIFSILSTETARRVMQDHLANARKYAGDWDDYVAAGFSTPQVYRFRRSSALYDANLLLSVVPSSSVTSGDVMLLIGREVESNAAASYTEDAVRWLDEVLRPQLSAFQRRVESLEASNWVLTVEDGKKLRGHLEACNRLLERYLRLASLNLETIHETWKPVRLRNIMQHFIKETALTISRAGNTLSTFVDDEVPLGEVFFDVEKALEVLRRVMNCINYSSTDIHISVELCIVRSGDPVACQRRPSRSRSSILPPLVSPPRSPPSITSPNVTMSMSQTHSTISTSQPIANIVFTEDTMRLCSTSQHYQLIDGYSSQRRIRFLVVDDAELIQEDGDLGEASKVSTELGMCRKGARSPIILQRVLKECESLIIGMGGSVSFNLCATPPIYLNTVSVEIPLLPVPWGDDDVEDSKDNAEVPNGRTLTVVVAERNAKERNALCRLMWARRHAVVPVTSYREVMAKIEAGDLDILVIDPLFLDITDDENASVKKEDSPFDALRNRTGHLVVVVHTKDFSDWRSRKLVEQCHTIQLPKPASEALLHVAMHEAERVVTRAREDEEQIALLRTAFSKFQSDRHKVGQLIGKGAFGDVYEVEDRLTGGKMAMKSMSIKDGVLVDDVVQELLAMTSLRHENIIHYFYCEKESTTQLRLFMELASGGTLQYKIRCAGGPLPREDIVRNLQDLCRGLAYVHSKNYVHGDIKTANALIDHYGRTKIGDFGTAKRLKKTTDELYVIVGSPQYMAPEVINADPAQGRGYNQKADIWSLGCVAMELATGNSPFSFLDCTHGMGIFFYLSNLTESPEIPPLKNGDPLIYDFIQSCLTVDPSKRPTACELLHHELLVAESAERKEQLYRHAELMQTLDFYGAINQSDGRVDVDEEEYEHREVEGIFASGVPHKILSTDLEAKSKSAANAEEEEKEGEGAEDEERIWTRVTKQRDFFSSSSSSSSSYST